MRLRWLRSFGPTKHDWRPIAAAVAATVVYGYLGYKFTLFASELRLLTGAVGGVALGLYFRSFYEGVEYATIAALVSVPAMFVVFVADDVIVTSRYDVTLPVIHFEGGPLLDQLLAYGMYEAFVFLTTGPTIVITALVGAWVGWVLRSIVGSFLPEWFE